MTGRRIHGIIEAGKRMLFPAVFYGDGVKRSHSGAHGVVDMDYSAAYRVAQEIRDSEEYRTYHDLKDSVLDDETTAALVKEYRKLQMTIQMAAMSGQSADAEDMQRFSGISALLFSKPEVSQYLLAEMRLQQALADIFKIVTEAADIEIGIPGLGG